MPRNEVFRIKPQRPADAGRASRLLRMSVSDQSGNPAVVCSHTSSPPTQRDSRGSQLLALGRPCGRCTSIPFNTSRVNRVTFLSRRSRVPAIMVNTYISGPAHTTNRHDRERRSYTVAAAIVSTKFCHHHLPRSPSTAPSPHHGSLPPKSSSVLLVVIRSQ